MTHSNVCWDHSTRVPTITSLKNTIILNILCQDKNPWAIKGNNKISSISKIKNTRAIIKNCKENGDRLDALGLNPHSNGESFILLSVLFMETILAAAQIIIAKIKQILLMAKSKITDFKFQELTLVKLF